jgi:hypothetical protein
VNDIKEVALDTYNTHWSRTTFEISWDATDTLPTAEILSGKNARVWVSMVLYSKKINEK